MFLIERGGGRAAAPYVAGTSDEDFEGGVRVQTDRQALLNAVLEQYARAVVLADPSRFDVWEALGLTMSQIRVLFLLHREPGIMAGLLAERLGVRPATVTGIVDRLVDQGLVRRCAAPDDRRVVRHQLTVRGSAVMSEISRAGRAYIGGVLEQLDNAALTRLHESLVAFTQAAEALGLLLPVPAAAGGDARGQDGGDARGGADRDG